MRKLALALGTLLIAVAATGCQNWTGKNDRNCGKNCNKQQRCSKQNCGQKYSNNCRCSGR